MTDLVEVLRDKISALDDEKEELEDALSRIIIKMETYEELLAEETGDEAPAPAKKRARGRPRGSKNRKTPAKKASKDTNAPKDALWEQAEGSLPEGQSGSTIEDQQKAIRRFNPTPRTPPNYGVKAGKPEDVLGDQNHKKSNVNISVEDD
ncbi:hypothetical protein LCGC14_2659730 [marine sediment metagenome]|uniref:Uncharacterized protein n=1 Tax=marine sediment metagenome TaxID=412755 RepID=A0A0F9CJ68_9ZZZZ